MFFFYLSIINFLLFLVPAQFILFLSIFFTFFAQSFQFSFSLFYPSSSILSFLLFLTPLSFFLSLYFTKNSPFLFTQFHCVLPPGIPSFIPSIFFPLYPLFFSLFLPFPYIYLSTLTLYSIFTFPSASFNFSFPYTSPSLPHGFLFSLLSIPPHILHFFVPCPSLPSIPPLPFFLPGSPSLFPSLRRDGVGLMEFNEYKLIISRRAAAPS